MQFGTIVIQWTALLWVAILTPTMYRQYTNREQKFIHINFRKRIFFWKSVGNYQLYFLHSAYTAIWLIYNSYHILFRWNLSSIKIVFNGVNIC